MATKPTDRPACPSWCTADHTRDGGVHRLEVGRADVGDGTAGERVPVVLQQVPGGEPTVTISGGLYVAVQPCDAGDMARLMDMAGQSAMAALIRRAADILQADDKGDTDTAEATATVPGSWPDGEPDLVRDAEDFERRLLRVVKRVEIEHGPMASNTLLRVLTATTDDPPKLTETEAVDLLRRIAAGHWEAAAERLTADQ